MYRDMVLKTAQHRNGRPGGRGGREEKWMVGHRCIVRHLHLISATVPLLAACCHYPQGHDTCTRHGQMTSSHYEGHSWACTGPALC